MAAKETAKPPIEKRLVSLMEIVPKLRVKSGNDNDANLRKMPDPIKN